MRIQLYQFITGIVFLHLLLGEENLKELQWLQGSWEMKRKNGSIIKESWQMVNDSTMTGSSVIISPAGQERTLETLSIVLRNNEIYYIPTVAGQNQDKPVSFRITEKSENGFVAENPAHDFPKRITYRLLTTDSIHAFIDVGPSMPEKKSDFYYSRIK